MMIKIKFLTVMYLLIDMDGMQKTRNIFQNILRLDSNLKLQSRIAIIHLKIWLKFNLPVNIFRKHVLRSCAHGILSEKILKRWRSL